MSCSSPIAWGELVAYWADDLPAPDLERVDLHLLGCAVCTAASRRICAIAHALRSFLPPVVTRATVDRLRARGARVEENVFVPGVGKPVVFAAGLDVLVHRLSGIDLASAQRVHIIVRTETGQVLVEDPDAPFDPAEGVLVACQRHYAGLPADPVFELRAVAGSGAEQVAIYSIPHVFEG